MQKWKAILLVAAILVQSFYCPVMAREARFLETAAPVLDLSAKSAVVMEQESKEILFAKDKDKELAPASVTKIMSLLLIFEDLKQGKIKLTDTVTVSEHAASMGGSQVFLETGEKQVSTVFKSARRRGIVVFPSTVPVISAVFKPNACFTKGATCW